MITNLKIGCTIILITFVSLSSEVILAEVESKQGSSKQKTVAAVGRENPFEKISLNTVVMPKRSASAEEIPELFIETVNLKFLDANSLKLVLKNMSSSYGNITTNPKSNSLIICDTNDNIVKILQEIKKVDITPPQIVIEVVIIDVRLNDDTEIGVNWDLLYNSHKNINYRQNFTPRLGSTASNATTLGDLTAFNTTGTGGDFSIVSTDIRNVIHMLQEKQDIEIIASPKVMVVSGKSATIQAVEEIPFNEVIETSEGGELSATSFKDVGVKLTVSALLTDKQNIHMNIYAEEKVTTGESDTGVPVVDARKAETSLLLKNGQVVILGGLRRKEQKIVVKQIPFLGDLPILGLLFKTNNTIINNSELIVLLSPRIYEEKPLPKEVMDKFNEIRDKPILSVPEGKKVNDEWWPFGNKK